MVLIGVLAMRLQDRVLAWDPENLRVANVEEANALLNPVYREGWSL